jgi:multiple sugar transport system ATP-binding protein
VRVDTGRLYFFDPVSGAGIWGESAPALQYKEGTHV